jgi:ABC-type uncharacterized transport system substrate-binding protein
MTFGADDAIGQTRVAALLQGLQQAGWEVGRNLRIELRWSGANPRDVRKHAGELAALAPDVIVANGSAATGPLLEKTRSVLIVFAIVPDPVGAGYVDSLARPGGNATGFTTFEYGIGGKWLELLKEVAPRATRLAFLFNPATAPYARYYLEPFKAAAASLGIEPIAAPVRDTVELETVIAAHAREPNGGLIVMPDAFTNSHREDITSLAARHRLPAVYPFRSFAAADGLLSYGNEQIDNFRRAAIYADRILRGAKPSELPVQGPVKFVLSINLKTAKALDLDVPFLLQQRADEVIE